MTETIDQTRSDIENMLSPSLRQQLNLDKNDLYGGVLKAKKALEAGDPGNAMGQFIALVLLDPTQIDHQIGLAESALAMGFHEIAMQSAAIVIQSAPERPEGYYLSGRACLALKEPALAIEDLTEAAKRARKISNTALAQGAEALCDQARAQL